MFDASGSKQLALLRYAILIDMVARGGSVYARDSRENEAYVNYLVAASDELNIVAGDIYQLDQVFDLKPGGATPNLACPVPMHGANPPEAKPARQVLSGEIQMLADQFETDARSARDSAQVAQANAAIAQAAATSAADSAGKIENMLAGQPANDTKDDAKEAPTTMPDDSPDTGGCLSYRVNFETDLPMIEKRLFRLAMAALPQKQAKQFLDQVTSGNLVSAVSAAFSFSVKTLDGLHSGAATHRTGLEVLARNSVECNKAKYSKNETVSQFLECLGLNDDKLFIGKQDNQNSYYTGIQPAAFMALMRNLRDSCRMIPISIDDPTGNLNAVRAERIDTCNKIEFLPRSRWQTKEQIDHMRDLIIKPKSSPVDYLGL